MTILEKEVWVGLGGGNSSYYEKLGYEIPREIKKYGKPRAQKGTKILVKLEDLSINSTVKITKVCDICGIETPNQSYEQVIKQRSDRVDYCRMCASSIKASLTKKNNVKYEKTLEYYAIKNNMEYLITEFSDKNIKSPDKINYCTPDKYLWNCSKCGSEYDMSPDKRTSDKNNCPYCSGKRVNETNSFWNTHREFALLLKNKQRSNEITAGHNGKEVFVCNECGHEQSKSVNTTVQQGFRCNKCSDGISYSEKFLFSMLDQLEIEFKTQHVFKWAKNKKHDFYIPKLDLIIEAHGEQHYIESFGKFGLTSLEEIQSNDKIKEKLALENGIDKYIVVDCKKSTINYLKNSVLSSQLTCYFNLANISWEKCHSNGCKSMVKTVCELWNEGIESTLDISKEVKLGRLVVTKYLKQGAELGWCNYDPKKTILKNIHSNNLKRRKRVIQLTKEGDLVREWLSANEVEEEIGINRERIMDACRIENRITGGFKWMYKDDYEKLLQSDLK